MNKKTDLKELLNDYDSDQVMDMIDNLIVADSVYDEKNGGQVLKKRASLNKEYGRIGITIDEKAFGNVGGGAQQILEPNDDGTLPGLEGIPLMGG